MRMDIFKKAKIVMLYIALSGEVKTDIMIRAAQRLGKTVVVPVCKKDRAVMRPCILDKHMTLKRGPYGVYEPVNELPVRREDIGLVVVPGLAFDQKGNRLGRGKGCYDRFLKKLSGRTVCIGLAFDFQILPSVPAAKHDVGVNKVLFA